MADVAKALLGAILATFVAVAAPPAGAQSLDAYRAEGVIAERWDGLVEVRGSAPAEAARLVAEVNARRQALYRERAQSQNVPVEEVGKIYAQEVLGKAPPGTYFRKPDGSYVRK